MTKRSTVLAGIGLAAVGLLVAGTASAGVVIGTANGSGCYPFKCNDSGTSSGESIDYQQFYSASAFSGPISITSLTFYEYSDLNPGQPVLNGDYQITLGTVVGGLGSQSLATLSNAQTFFSGTLGGETGETFTISGAGYNYDPSQGDLVMEVVVNNQDNAPNGFGNGYFEAEQASSVVSIAVDIPNFASGSDNSGLVTGFNDTAAPTPEPATWALMLAGIGGVGGMLRSARRKTAATIG
jgi:hypothetical protein